LTTAGQARPQWGLLADDLTGACDAAVQFAQRGFRSIVSLKQSRTNGEYDLVARTSHSRNDRPDVARSKIETVCSLFVQDCRPIIYKKVDSTLRGNLGAEIKATLTRGGFSLAVICPAFPAMGRIIEEGWLTTSDSTNRAVHLPTLLREQGLERVHHLDRGVLGSGIRRVAESLNAIAADRPSAVVVDAVTEKDLEIIAEATLTALPAALSVGSAGLAGAVAEVLVIIHGEPRKNAPKRPAYTDASGSVVLFIGSNSPVTAAQVEFLVSSRPVLHLRCGELTADKLRSALASGHHVVLGVDLTSEQPGLTELCLVLREVRPRGLVFSGGDTAQLMCDEIGAAGILLEREIAAGVPSGYLTGGMVDGCPVITKAGGFGARDALVAAVDLLSSTDAFTIRTGD